MTVESLRFTPATFRATGAIAALEHGARASGVSISATRGYRGGSDVLMVWGPGAPNRFEPMRRQLEAGGHVLALDCAYWDRDSKYRVSIDAAHPQRWVMKTDWPADRVKADRIATANLWDPKGPVIVAGLGEKARVQYGAGVVDTWEASMMAEAQRRGYTVQYRAKRGAVVPIDQALRGAALLITWHSNVAVDAIRMGIPVICRDGAAAAICPSSWPVTLAPVADEVRSRFLANLAYFQWTPSEADQCWRFLRTCLA